MLFSFFIKPSAAKKFISFYILALFFILTLLTGHGTQVQAQTGASAPEIEVPEPEWPLDTLGRRTPRGAVQGFISAISEEDYAKAAIYLGLQGSKKQRKRQGEPLARALQRLLDQGGSVIPYSLLSNDFAGRLDDNLGPNLERVGSATLNGESVDLFLEKTEGEGGAPVWLFAPQTVQRIPLVEEETAEPLVDRLMPQVLVENKWNGVPIGQWLALLLMALLSYALAWVVAHTVRYLLRVAWRKAREEPTAGIIKAFTLPVKLYLALYFFIEFSQRAGISIIVRQKFSQFTVIIGLAVFLLLVWRLIDVLTRVAERRMIRRRHQAGLSAVLFLRRGAKFAVLAFGLIALLGTLGFDVTTGLAALGIGGIALALGAQKTVENFVGSVTLIADQPIRVGDFCKFGSTVGTVESIGMRSTRIRTNDRTLVTIPNGDFSSQSIENYTHRDRIWFHPTFGVRCDTSPNQIRYLLVELRTILYAHPKIDPDSARVRLVGVGADSFNLEVFAYVLVTEYAEFLEIQEDLLLRMMDVVEASGSSFAFPSQTVYLGRDTGQSEEKAKSAEAKVREWQATNELPHLRFSPEKIKSLRNTRDHTAE